MSSSLISALSGGEEAAFQEQLKRQFRENLANNPDQMAAFLKATGGETPPSSPSALRADEIERMAATRRANAQRAGQSAIQEIAIAQGRDVSRSPTGQLQLGEPDPSKAIGRFAVRPSGLMQSQVEELPGGFKAVYDREGRLVGTNAPVQVKADAATKSPGEFMDAVDRAFFNKGDSTAAERAALYPAMEAAVRQQRADTVRPRQATKEGAVQQALDTLDKYPPPFRPTGTAFPPSLVDALTQVSIPDYRASIPAGAAPPITPEQLARFEDQMGEFYGTAPVPPSDPFLRSEYRTGSEWVTSGPRYGSPETGKAGPASRPQAPVAPVGSMAADTQKYLDFLRQNEAVYAPQREALAADLAALAEAERTAPSAPKNPAVQAAREQMAGEPRRRAQAEVDRREAVIKGAEKALSDARSQGKPEAILRTLVGNLENALRARTTVDKELQKMQGREVEWPVGP